MDFTEKPNVGPTLGFDPESLKFASKSAAWALHHSMVSREESPCLRNLDSNIPTLDLPFSSPKATSASFEGALTPLSPCLVKTPV